MAGERFTPLEQLLLGLLRHFGRIGRRRRLALDGLAAGWAERYVSRFRVRTRSSLTSPPTDVLVCPLGGIAERRTLFSKCFAHCRPRHPLSVRLHQCRIPPARTYGQRAGGPARSSQLRRGAEGKRLSTEELARLGTVSFPTLSTVSCTCRWPSSLSACLTSKTAGLRATRLSDVKLRANEGALPLSSTSRKDVRRRRTSHDSSRD